MVKLNLNIWFLLRKTIMSFRSEKSKAKIYPLNILILFVKKFFKSKFIVK